MLLYLNNLMYMTIDFRFSVKYNLQGSLTRIFYFFLYNIMGVRVNTQTVTICMPVCPLSSSDNHSASQFSSILRTKRKFSTCHNPNSYSKSTNSEARLSGSLSRKPLKRLFKLVYITFPHLGMTCK